MISPERRAEILATMAQFIARAEENLVEASALARTLGGSWEAQLLILAGNLDEVKAAVRRARLDIDTSEEWSGT